MQCLHPIKGWRSKYANPETGKFPILFKQSDQCGEKIELPCGKCTACRITKSMEWAIRAMHEAAEHDVAKFLTLTYSPENLPDDGGLNHEHFQTFIRAYRQKLKRAQSHARIRFLMCGEYGENPQSQPVHATHLATTIVNKNKRSVRRLGRPHYHVALFGHCPDDLEVWNDWSYKGKNFKLYTSKYLDNLWKKGRVIIGDLTHESAAYIARYTTKKIGGPIAAEHYKKVNLITGEEHEIKPEYVQSSRRPGLGKAWFTRYKKDLSKGFITRKNRKHRNPSYYERILEITDPEVLDAIKLQRIEQAIKNKRTPDELRMAEKILEKKIQKLNRGDT